jgi:hypothetical protein
MTRHAKTAAVLFLCVGLSYPAQGHPPARELLVAAPIAFSCHNWGPGAPPPTLRVVEDVPRELTVREVTFEAVQFNVNQVAGPTTIFVNGQNDGVCTATAPGRYRLLSGTHSILGSDANVRVNPPTVSTDSKTAKFNVRPANTAAGIVSIKFSVRYTWL